MIENLNLGIKDIWNNKKVFLSFLLMTFSLLILSISSTQSIVSELLNSKNKNTHYPMFSAELTEMNMGMNEEIVTELYDLFQGTGGSYFNPHSLYRALDERVLVLVGSKYKNYLENEKTTIYTTEKTKLRIQGEKTFPEELEYEFKNREDIDIQEIIEFEEIKTIIILQTNNFEKWIEVDYYTEVIELIENAEFSKIEIDGGIKNEFINIFDGTPYFVKENKWNDQLGFILKYIYVIVALCIVVAILATYIIYTSQIRKLYKEYMIHLICGATIKDIFIRSSIFLGIGLVMNFWIFMYLNKFIFNLIFIIGTVSLIVMFCMFEILLWFILKRKNLLENLKGDL
ncbi:MAG: hypothetical protein ACK5LZ_04875 [Anaerorhabdus sp.]